MPNTLFDTLKTTFFGTLWRISWTTVSVLVLVVSLTFFLHPSSPNNLIDISYNKIIHAPNFLTIQDVQRQIESPHKGTTRELPSFSSDSPRLSSAMQAFGAGLWQGRQDLLSQEPTIPDVKKDWLKTEWADYFNLGRWILLLETVSQSVFQFQYKVPNGFWEQQQSLFANLQRNFLKRREKYNETEELELDWVTSRFEEYIEPLLKQLPDDSKPHLYKELANELKEMREGLAPHKDTFSKAKALDSNIMKIFC